MKPAGTIEADLGPVNLSTGVQVRIRVVWHSGRTYLELLPEPSGDGTGGVKGFRPLHIRSDRLQYFIRRCAEADSLIWARGIRHSRRSGQRTTAKAAGEVTGEGAISVPPAASCRPAVSPKVFPNTDFSHMRAREAGE